MKITREVSVMDTKKVGHFLKQLRKENNMTQEQLGERIGVTNKTVSRWETGNYMPPVESLMLLSDLYQISINEILSGEHVAIDNFKEKADENLAIVLADLEKENKSFENKMMWVLAISTILASAIIMLNPLKSMKDVLVMLMVVALAFISNTLNIVALALKKQNRLPTCEKEN